MWEFLNGGLLGQNSPYTDEMRFNSGIQAMGQLGGGLLAANARTTDPSAYGRIMGQTMANIGPQMQQGLDQQLQMSEWQKEQDRQKAMQEYLASGAGGLLSPDELEFLNVAGPEVGMGLLGERMFAQSGSDPFTLSPGQVRYDASGNPIAEGPPDPVSQTTAERNAAALGYAPGTTEYTDYIRSVTMPASTNVTVNNGTDRAGDTLYELNASDLQDSVETARSFTAMLPDLNAAEQAIQAIPEGSLLEPGQAFPETRVAIARIASSFGVDNADSLGAADLLTAINSRIAPLMRAPGSGSQSDLEFNAYRSALPSMLNSREGNIQIIAHLRDMAMFSQAMADIKKQALINTADSPSQYDAEVKRLTTERFGTDNPSIGPSFADMASPRPAAGTTIRYDEQGNRIE